MVGKLLGQRPDLRQRVLRTSTAAPAPSGSWTPAGPIPSGPGRSATPRPPRSRRGGVCSARRKRHIDDDLRRLPGSAPPETTAAFEFDIGETHPPADGRQALGASSSAWPTPSSPRTAASIHVLDRRGPADSQLGCAPRGGLHWGVAWPPGSAATTAPATYVESKRTRSEWPTTATEAHLERLPRSGRLFPGSGSYPAGATPSCPLSINHLLGPELHRGRPPNIHVRDHESVQQSCSCSCSTLATAADIKGPLGQ